MDKLEIHIDNKVTGKTKLLGLIGNPVGHTISPQLHNTISSKLGQDYIYVPLKVDKGSLSAAVNGIKALNFSGFNVTIPYKNDVIQYLDEITDEVKFIGAANTVKISDGRLYGYNTDTEGFYRSFKEESGTDLKNKKVVILGAGGAARAIAIKTALEGAASIVIINRTESKAVEIADIINNNIGVKTDVLNNEAAFASKTIENADVIINTTSVGMSPDIDSSPVSKDIIFNKEQIVYDIIYNPVKTKLLEEAEEYGCKVINGLGMLFYQGIYAYEIWIDNKIKDECVKDIYNSFKKILNR